MTPLKQVPLGHKSSSSSSWLQHEEILCPKCSLFATEPIKTIFMSGYTDDIISKKGILEEGFDFISKPVNPDALLRKIRDVLDR
jgi:hypothetical protein